MRPFADRHLCPTASPPEEARPHALTRRREPCRMYELAQPDAGLGCERLVGLVQRVGSQWVLLFEEAANGLEPF